ncbi:MAG: phosphoribosyl-AMP cyclohydrolase, partial [Rhodospirillaceae bacterium]|nr:phosphoribosyl-AMP cyclohydrolase [Rhodospirillaceae bacterium]
KKTIETKEAHYWSRSRKDIWHKGKTSGFIQKVIDLRVDDDQDALWMMVDIGNGASCHVGYKSCFYREILTDENKGVSLKYRETEKIFDPLEIYGDVPNPTKL